jgi:hypothetical protein
MSNRQKSGFMGDIFRIQSFWQGHGIFLPKTRFIQEGRFCQEILIQQLVGFPISVTHKSLTVLGHLMDHRKVERVNYCLEFETFKVLANPRHKG